MRNKVTLLMVVLLATIGLMAATFGCSQPAPTTAPAPAPKTTTPAPSTTALAPAPGKTYSWKLATYYKPGDIRLKMTQDWADSVNKASNGAITVKVYDSDTFVKTSDAVDAVAKGLADMATIVPANLAARASIAATLQFSPVNDYAKFIEDQDIFALINKDEEAKANMHNIAFQGSGAQEFYMAKPISGPADLKGRLARSPGGMMDAFFTVWDGKPVALASSELYTAAQRGVVEGATSAIDTYVAQKLYEVFPYVMRTNILPMLKNPIAMNLDLWKSLSPGTQKFLTDKGWEIARAYYSPLIATDQKALDDMTSKNLVKVITLTDAQRAEWVKKLIPVFEAQVKKDGPNAEAAWKIIEQKYLKTN